MKKLFVPFIFILLLLAGCEKVTSEEAENARSISGNSTDRIEQSLAVGDTLNVEKVALREGYSLMYESNTGELEWMELNPLVTDYTVKKSDRDYSYLVREKNSIRESLNGYTPSKVVVTLYLNTDKLDGGSFKESCGKNCEEDINVEMLN